MVKAEELKFDEKGLIPAIVVDAETKKVLTLAYMNRKVWRSVWKKEPPVSGPAPVRSCGERERPAATGSISSASSPTATRDALVVMVNKDGPACHLGTDSCFAYPVLGQLPPSFSLKNLYKLLEGRKAELPEGSYTTYLFEKGLDKILKKVGEEATEVIIAGKAEDKAETVYEIADLLYHVLVLMVQLGINVEDVAVELESRHIIDHKVKQEKMTK